MKTPKNKVPSKRRVVKREKVWAVLLGQAAFHIEFSFRGAQRAKKEEILWGNKEAKVVPATISYEIPKKKIK